MTSTARFLIGCLTAGVPFVVAEGRAASPIVTPGLSVVAPLLAQSGGTSPATQSESLLRQARDALNRGDFARAEQYISQAERLNVQYDPVYAGLVDTPGKARRALEDMRAGRTPVSPRSDRQFVPTAGSPAAAPGALPPSAASGASPLDRLTEDATARARLYLNNGRTALQQGDLAGAIAWRQKALATGARFLPGEYSPDSLANELRRAGVPEDRLVTVPAAAAPHGLRPDDFADDARRFLPLPASPAASDSPSSALRGAVVNNPNDVPPDRRWPGSGAPSYAPTVRGGAAHSASAGVNVPGEPKRLPVPENAALAGARTQALRLLAQARAALDRGDAQTAQLLAEQARDLRVPDEAYQPGEPRPEHLLLEINSALQRQRAVRSSDAALVTNAYDPGSAARDQYPVRQSIYQPARDNSRTVAAQATTPAAPTLAAPPPANGRGLSAGADLYHRGVQALEAGNRDAALQLFSEAWKHEAELDPGLRQQLRDKLTLLRMATPRPGPVPSSPLEEVDSQQKLLREKVSRDVHRELSEAEKTRTIDPRGSLQRLQRLRDRVEQEGLDPPTRTQLLALVDRSVRDAEQYIELNRSDIELKERNVAAAQKIDRDRQARTDMQNKLAQLVEQFNDLVEEKRFAEAEVIAKQARELAPDEAVVRSMTLTSKMAFRVQEQESIRDKKEEGFYKALTRVDEASIPGDDARPYVFDNARDWVQMSTSRLNRLSRERSRLTPAELEIQKALKSKVEVRFENQSLSQVMDALGRMAGINVYLDPQGLHAEGITTDEPVKINLTQPISLRSALKLILEPLHLSYVIQNEVLRITSEQARASDVYPKVYNVADLVIPIPNFIPSYNIGLPGAIREAHQALTYGRPVNFGQPQALTLAANEAGAGTNASVLAQMSSSGMLPDVTSRAQQHFGYAPGNMGGATQADFDTLIDLITATIAPQSWDAVGGPGSIEGFPTNLSLVISQTQDVHEQIADLLDQLRRLQDLQVTIEVRFITLNDKFYERIGVNFNFNVDDNSNQIAGQTPILPDDRGPTIAFGLDPTGVPTADFDYQFTQGSFSSSIPQFGGFDANTAANFGFAILSDIEVFFLLQAAEGDDRTNVLQAPKVTLFNGQTGFVSDTSQRPFVTGVIPVVGDFAAAHQPVVVVLNEGTSLSVQAVVSPDRRFVRLTLIPFFSSIGDVDTFTFHGRTRSDSGTVVVDPTDDKSKVTNNQQNFTEGTTVQLPTFNFTTVSTTVSVPDGGTVLLGGIKRLSEGRNERGVPMLSKIPYINRLFRNIGIGRETQSLMMMVTPRIIIQEEEEFTQTGYDSSQQ